MPAQGLRRHREFRRLWGAQAVSAIGSQVTLLALPLTAILVLHAGAVQVTLLVLTGSLPTVAFGIPAGVWVDRVRRRPVMVAADLGRAVMLVSVPVAYGVGVLGLPQLYLVTFVNGTFAVLFEVAAQAYLPAVVGRPHLIEANAKFQASRVVASAAGPGLGGGLVTLLTAPVALLADAASFLASAVLIRSVPHREETPRAPDGGSRSRLRGLREGAGYVLGHRYLRPLLLSHASANLTFGLVWSIVIVYAVRELGLSAVAVGAVLSLGQIGGLAGAVLGRRFADRVGVGRAVVVAFFLLGPATLLLAVAPRSAAAVFLAAGWTLENLSRAIYGICATSLRQAVVPAHLQARVSGFLTTAGTGAFPLGTAVGSLAAHAGPRVAMAVGAAVSVVPFLPVALSPLRSLRELPP